MKVRKFVLGCYAVLFIVYGILGVAIPSTVAALTHYDISSPVVTMEFMATYGGAFLGLGCFMLYCVKSNTQTGLVCVFLTMGAMLIARTVGFSLYGGADLIQHIYLAGELLTAVLVGFMLMKPISTEEAVSQ